MEFGMDASPVNSSLQQFAEVAAGENLPILRLDLGL